MRGGSNSARQCWTQASWGACQRPPAAALRAASAADLMTGLLAGCVGELAGGVLLCRHFGTVQDSSSCKSAVWGGGGYQVASAN
jgi:hypothetical protein